MSLIYNYVFVLSGVPVPRLVERINTVISEGYRVAVFFIERPGASVRAGEIVGANTISITVPFRAAGVDRVFAFPRLAIKLRAKLLVNISADAFVYADSLDILAAICLFPRSRHFLIRYEVRDLHRHQYSPSLVGWAVRLLERLLMKRVSQLILTSKAYFEKYYKKFYRGPVVLLENFPDPNVWKKFQPKRAKPNDSVVIGLVGAIRYTDCVYALIEGARLAREEGTDVRLKIIGPDMEGQLNIDPADEWIERSGSFDYVSEIKSLYSDVDIIWSVYDTRIKNVTLALSNKLYESLLARIPVVAAAGTYLSERVLEMGIGTVVDDRSVDAISKVITSVRTAEWHSLACDQLDEYEQEVQKMISEHHIAEQQALFG